jgi:hypothetical protein
MLAACLAGAHAEIVLGNGKVETERRNVPAFKSISVSGSGTLRVHKGGQKVEISCDSNILPYITTTVAGDELAIGFKPFVGIRNPSKLQFEVTIPELRGVRLSGSGNAYVDAFEGGSFSADISGSGGIKADLDYESVSFNASGSGGFDAAVKARDFRFRCSGSGKAFLRGSADVADVVISGSADLGGRDFAVEDARISVSGSGRIEIGAKSKLDVTLRGSGDLRYWGNPTITQSVSGSGRIAKAGN